MSNNRGKVYVVQRQLRRSDDGSRMVDKFDVAPAEVFGDIQFLLSSGASPFTPESIVLELKAKLAGYNSDCDWLLLVGNPCLIGMVVAVAAQSGGGRVNMLQWSGRSANYIPVKVENLLYSA